MSAESIPGTDQVKCTCGWQGTTEDLLDKTCPICGEAFNQPELVNDWDVPFNGRAETATGHVYWYVKDGKRYPLKPVTVQIDV